LALLPPPPLLCFLFLLWVSPAISSCADFHRRSTPCAASASPCVASSAAGVLRRISFPSHPPARSPACRRSAAGAPVQSLRHSPAPPRTSYRFAGLPASRCFLQRLRPLHAPTRDVQIWFFQTRSGIFRRDPPPTRLACRLSVLLASHRCCLRPLDVFSPARGLHAPASGLHAPASGLLSPARGLHAPLRSRPPPPQLLMGLGFRVFFVIFCFGF
jgi:hypothetical protein